MAKSTNEIKTPTGREQQRALTLSKTLYRYLPQWFL